MSKAMEAAALVEMLCRAPKKLNLSICIVLPDDDSDGRAKAQHVTNGGKLALTIEEPKFFPDPSQRNRVFAGQFTTYLLPPKKQAR